MAAMSTLEASSTTDALKISERLTYDARERPSQAAIAIVDRHDDGHRGHRHQLMLIGQAPERHGFPDGRKTFLKAA